MQCLISALTSMSRNECSNLCIYAWKCIGTKLSLSNVISIVTVIVLVFKSICVPFLALFSGCVPDSSISTHGSTSVTGQIPREMQFSLILKWFLEIFWVNRRNLRARQAVTSLLFYSFAEHLFIRTFWQTMSREWNGIDNLRLDKYYMVMLTIVALSLFFSFFFFLWICVEYGGVLEGSIQHMH